MDNKKNNKKNYIVITKELQKSLIDFLDEVQLEAAKNNTNQDMHVINFCSYAIEELLNGWDAHFKSKKSKPQKKSRDQYLDETFMDWNLPEMSDEEYNKLVDQVDGFLRAWEKEYQKSKDKEFKPVLEDVAEYMTLEEIKDMLLDDDELSNHERFELYYEEHCRVQKEKNKTQKMLRKEYNKFRANRRKQIKKKK